MEHMMLLVTYRMLPGQRDAFLQEVAAAGILAKVQQEDGFERYDYYLSAADPDRPHGPAPRHQGEACCFHRDAAHYQSRLSTRG